MSRALLLLNDGTLFEGVSCGSQGTALGEVVFSTSMTGYQEMLTDPSYASQILIFTYPLIGNYGIGKDRDQSQKIQVAGCGMRSCCKKPSHPQSIQDLDSYLKEQGVVGIEEIDSRALTVRLRQQGVQMGGISTELTKAELRRAIASAEAYGEQDLVRLVSTKHPYTFSEEGSYRTAVIDLGVKKAILEHLKKRDCAVTVFPHTVTWERLLEFQPDGILFSPGPGDPQHLDGKLAPLLTPLLQCIREKKKPALFGVCLGHQLLARAFGLSTFKLPFGHRGANHPVFWKETERVTITAQNHGYAVRLKHHPELLFTHFHVNDGTVEGFRHRSLPIFTAQFHPEAAPGPLDNQILFDHFLKEMGRCAPR